MARGGMRLQTKFRVHEVSPIKYYGSSGLGESLQSG